MTTFDYQAALKEQPESEVAKYLAEQHGVDRDAYLKDGHSDADFINEYGPREFPEDQANDTQYNKTGAATLGAIAGASPTLLRTAKGVVQGAAHGFLNRAPQAPTFTPPSAPPAGGLPTSSVQVMSPSTGEAVHGGQTWVKKLTGVDLPGAQMEKSALDKAKEMSSVVGRGGELAGGEITSSGIMLPPARTTAEQAAAEKAALREAQLSETGQAAARKYLAEKAAEKAGTIAAGPSIGQRVLQAGQSVLEAPGVSKVLKVAGPIAGLASAAEQYEDMRERMHHGDYARGVVSGLGALGSGVATVPFFPPQVRAIGAGVGLAAPGINYLADKVAGRSYASGGLVYLADGGQPPKPYADDGADTGPYIGYRPVQRQAQNQYGSGSGFLDAALGAPAQHTNVLDPRDASYMSGYEKGEPYGLAAGMLPFGGMVKPVNAVNKLKFLENSVVKDPVFHMAKEGSPLIFDPKYKTELSSHGYHFGTAEQANFRQGQYDFAGDSPAIGKYHLSIKKPLEVSHMESFAPDHLSEKMMDLNLITPEKYEAISLKHNYDSVPIGNELVKILKKNKYDGLMYQNEREGAGLSYVPFEPTQIKSATGNLGTFDPTNPDITKKRGGKVKKKK